MNNVRRDLLEKKNHISQIITFIQSTETIEDRNRIIAGIDSMRPDLKAAVVVMLYNEVESTITSVLERIHDTIISKEIEYSKLSDKIASLVIRYYDNAIVKCGQEVIYEYKRRQYEVLHDREPVNISYEEFTRFCSLFSGNLDSKEVNRIMRLYGISEAEGKSELKSIKDKRNQLAHGIFSFSEVGRDISSKQLEVSNEKTFQFLEDVISKAEDFVDNDVFLKDR